MAGKHRPIPVKIFIPTHLHPLQTATKIGTGFSEQQLAELYELLKPLEASVKRGDILADPSKPPDVWFEPKVVMEVLCADLSLSP